MRWFWSILAALIVIAAIYVGSAVVSVKGLADAARARDVSGVLARTDIVRVRRSMVDQILAAYFKQIGQNRPIKPLERLAANTYGATIADAMIGKMLTEENLTSLLNAGEITSDGSTVRMPRLADLDAAGSWAMLKRIAPVKPVEFEVSLGDKADAGGISMHFEGNGWKLSGIRLPSAALQSLTKNLADSRGSKD